MSSQKKTHPQSLTEMEIDHACCLETFANDLRMQLLKELQAGPKNVTQLTDATSVERSRVSHALMELRKCNVVATEKSGRSVIYTLKENTPITMKEKGILSLVEEHARMNCEHCHKTESHKIKSQNNG